LTLRRMSAIPDVSTPGPSGPGVLVYSRSRGVLVQEEVPQALDVKGLGWALGRGTPYGGPVGERWPAGPRLVRRRRYVQGGGLAAMTSSVRSAPAKSARAWASTSASGSVSAYQGVRSRAWTR